MKLHKAINASIDAINISIVGLLHHLDKNFLADYKTGFGGQFGVQTDRVDKNAVGWEHNEKV